MKYLFARWIRYLKGIQDVDIRFFFFFPPPAGPLLASSVPVDPFAAGSGGAWGAGVTEDRIVVVTGVSAITTSIPWAEKFVVNVIFEWAAVVFIACRSSILFCCLFGISDCFASCGISASSSSMESDCRFLLVSKTAEGSVIGQTNPVRGV